MSDKSFVYEGTEVVKTGRIANKPIKKPDGTVLKTLQLHEIKPKDQDIQWFKWVDPNQLYEVE